MIGVCSLVCKGGLGEKGAWENEFCDSYLWMGKSSSTVSPHQESTIFQAKAQMALVQLCLHKILCFVPYKL